MPVHGPREQYGWQHQKARLAHLAKLQDGDPCARCRQRGIYHPMYRRQAPLLDLDHNDQQPDQYNGLAYRRCNRQAGAHKRWSKPRLPPTRLTQQAAAHPAHW